MPDPHFDRRKHLRAPLHLECHVVVPETGFQCRAEIRDASTGGMLVHATRMARRNLSRPFWILFTLGEELFQVPVQPVNVRNDSEVGVCFRTVTPVLSAILARTIFTSLREARKTYHKGDHNSAEEEPARRLLKSVDVQLKSDLVAEVEARAGDPGRERARKVSQAVRGQHRTMHDALVDARNRHKDRAERWKDKQTVSYE
ncbi:MAG: PilZ domain-containing protein [bacterium]|nr:PilZ domain-containing protein [bacterium]